MTRFCACPCKKPLVERSERALYVDHRHAQRAYRERLREGLRSAGFPATLSLRLVETGSPSNDHNGDAQIGGKRPKTSGLQLAYYRTYDALVDHFISRGEPYPEVLARKILSVGLSDRQRALIHARNKRAVERKAA